MEPLYLQSEAELYKYLKKFLKEKPGAVQLDGSTTPKANRDVVAVFQFSLDNKKYKLLGELTRKAAENFVALADEQGDPGVALKENKYTPEGGLVLANSKKPDGWACLPYTDKSSDKLKRVA